MIFQFIIVSCFIFLSAAQLGALVNCPKQNCSSCDSFQGFSWKSGGSNQCQIANCSSGSFPTQNLSDQFCGSCSSNALYANLNGTQCIQITQSLSGKSCIDSSISCSSDFGWSDADCAKCNPSSPYSNQLKTNCVASTQTCSSASNWTDYNCNLCNPSQPYAAADKNGCVASTISCSSVYGLNDNNCQLCSPSTPYANIQQTGCVKSSTKCVGRDPTKVNQLWTDNDCIQCYATCYKASSEGYQCVDCNAITGMNNSQCSLCNGTGQGANQYANSQGVFVAVKCNQRSGWVNSDFSTCNYATLFASLDGTSCQNVICSQPGVCTNQSCGTFSGFQWQQSTGNYCQIQDCSSSTLPSSGLTDQLCGSCPPSSQAIYANSQGTSCVVSTISCSSTKDLTDSICKLCNSKTPFANQMGTSCVASTQSCKSNSNWTDQNCSLCYSNQPYANTNGTACVASTISCKSSSGWTDQNCNLCNPSTPFASLNGKKCIASTISCSSTSNWTDADCILCNPSTPYATTDGKRCVASTISCSSNSGWTDTNCVLCNTSTPFTNIAQTACVNSQYQCIDRKADLPNQKWTDADCISCYSFSYISKQDGSGCLNCYALSGMTNSDCQLCNGSYDGANQYANSLGACVSINCSQTSGWVTSDCSMCNPSTPTPSSDGTICVSVTNSYIIKLYLLSLIIIFVSIY
ncbi:hypothetical protein ABPG72_009371 [Tetrahymena utriculariae]